ncbi:Fungal-trans domain-containing protein, partial [Pyrenophora tritici-repentis]
MSGPRPKLTRRRGACEECRQKKVRCDGANPCSHCQRNESLCEYNTRRSQRHLREKSVQSLDAHVSATTQPYAMNVSTMPDSSNPDRSSKAVVNQSAEGLAIPLDTPFSEMCFSQLLSDSAHSYLDFAFPDETTPNTDQAQIIEPGQRTSSFQNQISYYTPENETCLLDWLKLGCDKNLQQHSLAQPCDSPATKQGDGAAERTLALFLDRVVADKAQTNSLLIHRTYRVAALFQTADGGSRRRQTVLEKVKVLLSSEYQTCLFDLLRRADSGGEHQSLDLNDLPVEKLVQRAFEEPEGLSLFLEEQDIMRIQDHFFARRDLTIDVSDMSLLVVSLAWGALLEPEVSSGSKVALLDAVLEISRLLLRQNSSVRQFLALVAALGLAEKTGSDKLHALILGSISTAASLGLHLEPVLHKFCTSHEQAIQTTRAMWLLYCIDKSYALRWQTFPLVSEGSLPTTNPPESTPGSDVATTSSSEWLWIRSQYSKICSSILQLRVGAEEEQSKDHFNRVTALSTALEEWHRSTRISQMMLSLNHNVVMRIKLQTSYYYYEARFQLLSTSLLDPQYFPLAGSQE